MKTIYRVLCISVLWVVLLSSFRIMGDTSLRLHMAHAWLTGVEEITLPADYNPESRVGGKRTGVLGRDGKRYITYDVGQSLLMIPGDWLGIRLHKAFPKQNDTYFREIIARWATFVPLNVLLIVSCFWLLRIFNFSNKVAGLGSFVLY